MRIGIVGVLLFVVAGPISAGEPTIVDLWPEKPPGYQVTGGPERDTSTADSRLVAGRSIIRLGQVSAPQLHVYPAAEATRNGTAVVICPGGAFKILAWDLEGTEVAEWLNSLGVTAAVLKYRVPTHDAETDWVPPVQDAQRAIRWLRANREKWSIDAEKIGIMGFSAGGKTAAMTAISGKTELYEPIGAIDEQSPRPDFQMLIYPAYLVDEAGQLRPEVTISETSPPAFLVHAQDDPVPNQNSVKYFLALDGADVPAELHVFQSGGHGYGLRETEQPVSDWPDLCEDWLRLRGLVGDEG